MALWGAPASVSHPGRHGLDACAHVLPGASYPSPAPQSLKYYCPSPPQPETLCSVNLEWSLDKHLVDRVGGGVTTFLRSDRPLLEVPSLPKVPFPLRRPRIGRIGGLMVWVQHPFRCLSCGVSHVPPHGPPPPNGWPPPATFLTDHPLTLCTGMRIAVRIGLHAGRCLVGNFGASSRWDYTAVNRAEQDPWQPPECHEREPVRVPRYWPTCQVKVSWEGGGAV